MVNLFRWRHFALSSVSLIFLRNQETRHFILSKKGTVHFILRKSRDRTFHSGKSRDRTFHTEQINGRVITSWANQGTGHFHPEQINGRDISYWTNQGTGHFILGKSRDATFPSWGNQGTGHFILRKSGDETFHPEQIKGRDISGRSGLLPHDGVAWWTLNVSLQSCNWNGTEWPHQICPVVRMPRSKTLLFSFK